jgi:sugar lactone lactonase YvrE
MKQLPQPYHRLRCPHEQGYTHLAASRARRRSFGSWSWLLLTVTLFARTSPTALAEPGDIYVSNFANGSVTRFNANGAAFSYLSNYSALTGLNFDGNGNLFLANYAAGQITKISRTGVATLFAQGLNHPTGLAFDRFGNLHISDEGSGSVFAFNPDGTRSTLATGLSSPQGLAFDPKGVLYIANRGAGTIVRLVRGAKNVFASGLAPQSLAFDSLGILHESEISPGVVNRFKADGTHTAFATAPGASGLAFDSHDNLFVTQAGSSTVILITPAGQQALFASGLMTPGFVTVEPSGHRLLNISTRGGVQTGDHVLIAGFVVGGNGAVDSKVIVRALGPSLTAFGVADALQDPTLTLADSNGVTLFTNDNWAATQQAEIISTGIAPTDSREAAIVATLGAGSYTAVVRGTNQTTGDALVEVYVLQ